MLLVEILLIERFEALTEWIPGIIAATALAGAILAAERARVAVLKHRARLGTY